MYYKFLEKHPKYGPYIGSELAPLSLSLLLLLINIISILIFYPDSVPLLYLTGTLLVTTTSILFGRGYGFINFALYSLFAYILPYGEYSQEDSLYKYLAFAVTSLILVSLVYLLKRTEQDAKTKEQKLEIIYDSLSDVVVTIDSDATVIFANPQLKDLFGYAPEELIGKSFKMILSEEDQEGCEMALSEYKRTGRRSLNWKGFDVVGRRKDGSPIDIELSLGEYKDKGQTFFSAIMRDISLRKRYEQGLKDSQERYKTFIENSEEAIWMVEYQAPINTRLPISHQINAFFSEGRVKEANKITLKLYGKTAEEFIGKRIEEIIPRTPQGELLLDTFIKNGYSVQNFESQNTDEHGNTHWGITSLKGVVEDGYIKRAWCVQREITERKLYEINLKEAKTALEIANAEKDRFLANLSHELRTPLVSILGYSSMMLEYKIEDPQLKMMVETIQKNAKHQVQLIQDLLDVSRIISGKIELEYSSFSLCEVLEEACRTFLPQIAEKGLKIESSCSHINYYGDKKRISQIILNLVSNAVKYTDSGFITVIAKVCNDHVKIKVTDTGVGIDSKNFPLLFKPFKQLDSSSTKGKQGLGLGLSIVKTLTELHGGTVRVESELGKGSEFTVFLPITQVELNKEIEESKPNKSFEGVRLLIVEDDSDSSLFLKYLYETKKAVVDVASSAKEAREYIGKNKYNLYIFDIAMPVEDGLSLIRSVRANDDRTKAVALTAFGDLNYEKEAIEAGFDMFLKKPSPLSDLLSVINLLE